MNRPIKFRAWEDGKYEIGSDGSVWSTDYNHTGKRKKLNTYPDKDGYPHVFLVRNSKRTKLMVHRAVAILFLSKMPTPKHQVNHKNGIRHDNRIENLEWVTSQENTIDGWKRGRKITEVMRENGRRLAVLTNKKRWGYENN